jgi:hypothetical protein
MQRKGWLYGTLTLLVASTWLLSTPAAAQVQEVLDHFKCYEINGHNPAHVVALEDQFGAQQTPVGQARLLCTPVTKTVVAGPPPLPIVGDHLVCYQIQQQNPPEVVNLHNQLGHQLNKQVGAARWLCVPTEKVVID